MTPEIQPPDQTTHERDFTITVLGRTLEHLGVQMYKRRDVAVAELVANCWDAGAKNVEIDLPGTDNYDPLVAEITIIDDGEGMTDDSVQENYLAIGRNRRAEAQPTAGDRKAMGRKGIGKLAGFGLAKKMEIMTWRSGQATCLELDVTTLKRASGSVHDIPVPGTVGPAPPEIDTDAGTRLVLRELKHKTRLDDEALRGALARRFSRTVRGHMSIKVNGVCVEEPTLALEIRDPIEGENEEELQPEETVRWWAGFSEKVLPTELQGFTVLVRGKTAQAPPYFFGVESTATAQHGTKYLTGVIEADYLDDGDDDESDRISTDRQEIDWADSKAQSMNTWGGELVRRLLRLRRQQREDKAESYAVEDPDLASRMQRLDQSSSEQVRRFIRALGAGDTDPERIRPLADTIVRAYEYRQFHDFITELDQISDEPEQLQMTLEHLREWRVLESRAILEIVKGRLEIVEKFHSMIVNDSSETAASIGAENLHDLVADYPWLINPDWQILSEEKTITSQLREWGNEDIVDPEDRTRYDFLALSSDSNIVVLEIKRSGHAVKLEDLQRLERYLERLAQARPNIHGAFISGEGYALTENLMKNWKDRDDIELLRWAEIHTKTRKYYEHYRAVLEGDVKSPHFSAKVSEVARTREVVASGSYRGRARRQKGLGPQDMVNEPSGETS
ncbi:MAG: ATP-binding protein [Actinomycetota bacterium]